jgi:uncharacterized ferredoxin-like protein
MAKRYHAEHCEICGLNSPKALENHHIIPQTDPRCTNNFSNIAIICGSCHNEVHAGIKIIEGRYMSTVGNKLFWHLDGEKPIIRSGVFLLKSGLAEIRE